MTDLVSTHSAFSDFSRTLDLSAEQPQVHTHTHTHTHTQRHFAAGCVAAPTLCLELDCQTHTQTQTMLSIGVFWGDNCQKHDNGICHPDVAAVSASISIMKESFTNCKWE